MSIRLCILVLAGLWMSVAAGCGQDSSAPAAAAGETVPAEVFVTTAPADARDVAPARQEAREGQEVTVRGRIAGRATPFVDGRAMFILTDMSLAPCNAKPGDGCPTPWDLCCETPEDILKNSVMVQIAGADGKALKASLKDQHGLKPLAEVVVAGTVAPRGDGNTFVVNAKRIYVR